MDHIPTEEKVVTPNLALLIETKYALIMFDLGMYFKK
jgi:hypothetical protein